LKRSRRYGAYHVQLYPSADSATANGELGADLSPPGRLPHRLDWIKPKWGSEQWWLVVRDLQRRPVAGFSVTVIPTRALPGHRLLRLGRLRFAPDPGPAEAAVHFLVDLARRDKRTLSVAVEPFFADEIEREHATVALERAGFRLAGAARMYTHTLRIDLTREPETIFSSFHSTARRHIRAVAKHPVEVRLVQDPALAARLEEVLDETFARTAAAASPESWPPLIRYCLAHPEQARLVSLFRTDRAGPEALVAFALGLNHGDHVQYAIAGSTRPPDLRMPFGYVLAWDLMCWARTVGAQWFDFGGIVPDLAESDERHGIQQFKCCFGGDVVEVRQHWWREFQPVRRAWVRAASWLAVRIRDFIRTRLLPRGKQSPR
jgi:hypothetical protein